MNSLAFLSLFIATAFASTPTPQESLRLNNAPAVMIAVAFAESNFQQFDSKGNLLCDGVTHTHCGIYQIGNEHRKEALAHNWNIDEPSGNISEALFLYSKYGTSPWKASFADKNNPNSWGQYFTLKGVPIGHE